MQCTVLFYHVEFFQGISRLNRNLACRRDLRSRVNSSTYLEKVKRRDEYPRILDGTQTAFQLFKI